jgi:peptidoglycan/xylan/chitin deacetylase (PgdA/CDA1 family)
MAFKFSTGCALSYSRRYFLKKAFYGFQKIVTSIIWPWFLFQERFFPPNLARILTYHCVTDFPKEKEIPYDNVPPALFEFHMRILEKGRFNVIPLGDLAAILESKKNIPPRTLAITFDDGYKNNFLNALPVLEKRGFKSTFFVIAEGIKRDEPFQHLLWDAASTKYYHENPLSRLPMNAQELRTLRALGHEIGSHGLQHRSIGNLASAEARDEIIRSKEILEDVIKGPVNLFAYPFGAGSYGDFNSVTLHMLRQAGYRAACTGEISAVTRGSHLYELPRIPVRETDTPLRFKQKLFGAFEWINPFKRIFQKKMPRIDKVS